MSDSNRSDRIRALFDEVAGLEPEERTAHLAQACGDDGELRREVESLLEAEDARGSGVRRALEGLQPAEESSEKGSAPSGPGEIPAALQSALADRYRLVRELGRGGMAKVYLADDLKLPRQVAIKVMNPDLSEALGADRFLREIETASSLTHPHILKLHDSGEAEGLLYYVMPYVEGESLRARLKREKQLPVEDAVRIAREVADALAYAHDRDLIHRDVKPANILLEAGHAVLADFGVAKAVAEVDRTQLTQGGTSLGTPAYMSPEQMSSEKPLDGRSDQYALACVLYEMLAGQPPHQGPSLPAIVAKMMAGPAPSVRTLRKNVPEGVDRALAVALERKPEDRHATVAEFGAALAGGAPPKPKRRWAMWAATAAMAAVVALAWYMGAQRSGDPGVDGQEGLNPNLIAVLPFTVRGSEELADLEAGIAQLLSTALDGAGELTTVEPRAVIRFVEREATGPLDAESARAIAAGFGAGGFILGDLVEAGGRIRANASLYDSSGEPQATADAVVTDETGIIELVDEVARQLIAASAGDAGDEVTRVGAVTTDSLTALKAYLRGEAIFRAGLGGLAEARAAVEEYRQAVTVDTAFALAYFRMAFLNGTHPVNLEVGDAAERARRFSDRLPPRERLLLECFAAVFQNRGVDAERSCRAVLGRDPNNPDAWFLLGDHLMHHGLRRGRDIAEVRGALDRAIALEPTYLHYRLLGHRAWIAAVEEDFDSWAEYTERAMQGEPDLPRSRGDRLLLHAWQGDEGALEERIAWVVGEPYWGDSYIETMASWPLENRVALVRMLRGITSPDRSPAERAWGHQSISHEELASGRLSAARAELAEARSLNPEGSVIERTYLLLSPYLQLTRDDFSALRDDLVGWSPVQAANRVWRLYLLGLLDERLDNLSGAEGLASELEALADTLTTGDGTDSRALAEDLALYLRARLAVNTRRYGEAWRLLQQTRPERWWNTIDWRAYQEQLYERWLTAEVLVALDRPEDALHWLAGIGLPGDRSYVGIRHFRMAEIYEDLGDPEKAAHHYGRFVTYWKDADSEFKWRVDQAQAKMEALQAGR